MPNPNIGELGKNTQFQPGNKAARNRTKDRTFRAHLEYMWYHGTVEVLMDPKQVHPDATVSFMMARRMCQDAIFGKDPGRAGERITNILEGPVKTRKPLKPNSSLEEVFDYLDIPRSFTLAEKIERLFELEAEGRVANINDSKRLQLQLMAKLERGNR